jgi:hypothetical protein
MSLSPRGYSQITSLSTAKFLNGGTLLTIPIRANSVFIQPETKDIRWRDDGTAPTATVGMLLRVGETLQYDGPLDKIQLIEVEASATVNLSFYRN